MMLPIRFSDGFDSAMADYNKAIAPNPEEAEYYRARGEAYRSKGDIDSANADFNHADNQAR